MGWGRRAAGNARQLAEADLKLINAELLKIVNLERTIAGAQPLELDVLAGRVAAEHALDMARGIFLSHWGRDGRKPYHRYSFAGGTDGVAENVSALSTVKTVTAADIIKDLTLMHLSMHSERPPNDLHRRTILAPHNTHVGFGAGIVGNNLRLVEEYVSRYSEVTPFARQAKPKAMLQVTGRLLKSSHKLHSADVFYEPLPTPPELSWLNIPRPYQLPAEHETMRPKAPEGMTYRDGTTGNIKVEGARFSFPVKLYKESPGIYTVVLWVSAPGQLKPFPATNICIQAE